MKLNSKLTIIGIICFLGISFYGYYLTRKEQLNYKFNGIVRNISYNEKGYAKISIDGVVYDLGGPNFHGYSGKISKGDSLIKNSGTLEMKLIKKNGDAYLLK